MLFYLNFSYNNLLKRGTRIALRAKVNDSLIFGVQLIDSLLPVGRGQRQLILGDRYTGKTSLFSFSLLHSSMVNVMHTLDGFGSKRLFGLYIGLSQSLNKLSKLIHSFTLIHWFIFIFSTQPSSSSLLSFMIPMIGISIAERIKDRGFDVVICFDDLSKHSRSYRQISLLQNKIPSRDAYPSDVFNIHSSLLERAGSSAWLGTLRNGKSTISCLPIIETINADISEYIATNVISITDGNFVMNKTLFNLSSRPAIDSSLSVTRIGSNAQCKWLKAASAGIKNELTTKRNNSSTLNLIEYAQLTCLNYIFFQDYLFITSIESSLILLLVYHNGILFNNLFEIYRLLYLLSSDFLYLYYILFISKNNYNVFIFTLVQALIFNLLSPYLLFLKRSLT